MAGNAPALAQSTETAGCGEEVLRLAQHYGLSLSPTTPSSREAPAGTSAEAPATTESRGLAGPDSLASSGGSLPPSTSTREKPSSAPSAAAGNLDAADRAKMEGLLAQARAAAAGGQVDQCWQHVRAAQAILHPGG